ncbi:MAG: hypothetical protein ACYC6L_14910, partial [Anaerolineae bacterium]
AFTSYSPPASLAIFPVQQGYMASLETAVGGGDTLPRDGVKVMLVNAADTSLLGMTGLVLQTPMLVNLVNRQVNPGPAALAVVNTCISAFMRRQLLEEIPSDAMVSACSRAPLTVLKP